MRVAAILLGVWLVAMARPAEACGAWSMVDKEKTREIRFLINSASITAGKRRVGAFYLDVDSARAKRDGIRTVQRRSVVFDIAGDKLRKRGKPIATIDGNTITFGKRTYTIELSDPHEFHDALPAWKLVVTRGSDVIVESAQAVALCNVARDDLAAAEQEVRRRVMYYLAWREVGA